MSGSASNSVPPFENQCTALFQKCSRVHQNHGNRLLTEERDLPSIDLRFLKEKEERNRVECKAAIRKAAAEWGFFQVLNHGVSEKLLKDMKEEQKKLLRMSFEKKKDGCGLLSRSYKWGNPLARSLQQYSWSEAYHISLADIQDDNFFKEEFTSAREVMRKYSAEVSKLALTIAEILAENLGQWKEYFAENCKPKSCVIRLNRYPPCPFSPTVMGFVSHTDSDFLTILSQDNVGGLCLMKDRKWIAVKPNPKALIVNIGDLFQAWSNGLYKSVEHKVIASRDVERYSTAYFMCPSPDSLIQSKRQPRIYRSFTYGEFRRQVEDDVRKTGNKIGLQKFLISP